MRPLRDVMLALGLMVATPFAAAAEPFDLGPVVRMRDVAPGGNYEGTWTRRGDSNVYDARWVFVPTGQVLTDVLEVRGVEDGKLVIHRQGIRGTYSIPVVDGKLGHGTASWVADPAYHWEVLSPLPAAAPKPATPPPYGGLDDRPGERWVAWATRDGAVAYDATFVRVGATVMLSVAVYSRTNPPGGSLPWHYLWQAIEFDCTEPRFQVRAATTYDAHGQESETLSASDWRVAEPGSLAGDVRAVACGAAPRAEAKTIGAGRWVFHELHRLGNPATP